MTPRGPSAGSRRVRPLVTRTGLLGVVLLGVRAILTGRPRQDRPPAKADTPSGTRRTGPRRPPLVHVRADPPIGPLGSRSLPVARQVPVLSWPTTVLSRRCVESWLAAFWPGCPP